MVHKSDGFLGKSLGWNSPTQLPFQTGNILISSFSSPFLSDDAVRIQY